MARFFVGALVGGMVGFALGMLTLVVLQGLELRERRH